MNKAKFFEIMRESRVNVTAHIKFITFTDSGRTALVMNQDRAPNAFLSFHNVDSKAFRETWDKYERWLNEYFMTLDEIIEQDHADAIEEDREIQVLLAESDEITTLEETEKKAAIEIIHDAALVMNAEIDDLSQKLADRRCYWQEPFLIHRQQLSVLNQYKLDAFKNGPRIVQHVVKVMVISKRLALKKTGYAEKEPDPSTSVQLDECEIPF